MSFIAVIEANLLYAQDRDYVFEFVHDQKFANRSILLQAKVLLLAVCSP